MQLSVSLLPGHELPALKDDWNALAGGVPLHSWQWLHSWWEVFQSSHTSLWVLGVRDSAGALVGIAPWLINRSALHGRIVHFLGGGEVCTDHLTILARPEDAERCGRAIAGWLAEAGAGQWDALDLDGVTGADPAIDAMLAELRGRRHATWEESVMNCWRLHFPATWEALLKSLSRSRRERVNKLQRRVFDTGRVVVHRAIHAESLAEGWEKLTMLHQRRWKDRGKAGCFDSEDFLRFHERATKDLLAEGMLRLQWVDLDGHTIAAEYSICDQHCVYYYQAGFDPDFSREHPGWILQIASLRGAIAEGKKYFDFLRGDEPYKASWGAVPRPIRKIRVAGRHLGAQARHGLWLTGRKLKQWLKRGLGRARDHEPGQVETEGEVDSERELQQVG